MHAAIAKPALATSKGKRKSKRKEHQKQLKMKAQRAQLEAAVAARAAAANDQALDEELDTPWDDDGTSSFTSSASGDLSTGLEEMLNEVGLPALVDRAAWQRLCAVVEMFKVFCKWHTFWSGHKSIALAQGLIQNARTWSVHGYCLMCIFM